MYLGPGFRRMENDYWEATGRRAVLSRDDGVVVFVTGFTATTINDAYGHMYDILSRRIDVQVP